MASSYDISTGSGVILLDDNFKNYDANTIYGVQAVSTSDLDSSIQLKLQQSSNGVEFHDLPETPIDTDAGANSNLLQTASFFLDNLYLSVNVQSATVGTLNLFSFGK